MNNRNMSEIYEKMAKEYLKGEKTMYKVCRDYEGKPKGFFPNISTLSRHVSKIRKATQKIPYYDWAIVCDVD
jgi:hypothetical protein